MLPCDRVSIRDFELHDGREDIFFDSFDFLETSLDSEPSTSNLDEKPELEARKISNEFLAKELSAVHERCKKFLRETGFDKLFSTETRCPEEPKVGINVSLQQMEMVMMPDSLSIPVHCGEDHYISMKTEGTKTTMLDEVGSNRAISLDQQLLYRPCMPGGVHTHKAVKGNRNQRKRWWASLSTKRSAGDLLRNDDLPGNPEAPKALVKKVSFQDSTEITEFRMLQEIAAHKGLIRTMKLSPCGMYLATGGEDSVVRVWKVRKLEASTLLDETEKCKFRRKGFSFSSTVSPHDLNVEEVPLHEYYEHTSDILDLSWSRSNVSCFHAIQSSLLSFTNHITLFLD